MSWFFGLVVVEPRPVENSSPLFLAQHCEAAIIFGFLFVQLILKNDVVFRDLSDFAVFGRQQLIIRGLLGYSSRRVVLGVEPGLRQVIGVEESRRVLLFLFGLICV